MNKQLTSSSMLLASVSSRFIWAVNGIYSRLFRKSATAIPVRIMLTGFLMSLWVSTRMLARLNRVPRTHTSIASQPWMGW